MTLAKRCLFAMLALLLPFAAAAQQQGLEIDIIGGDASALPIAVVPMPYQGTAAAPETDVAAVVRADLERSGQFRALPERDMVGRPTRGAEVDYPAWRALRQDFLVVGRVVDAAGGSFRVEYELFDVARQERLLGLAMTARANAMRDVAHQMADAIYEKILGVRGAFWTRIAYVTATGAGEGTRYALMVADADGYNPQTVVRSNEPLLSPAWSPDGGKLAYVSFERGNSAIYIQDITTGARELVSSFRGINSGPAFSPDGSRLALTLSRSGNPEIYVMDLGSKALTQDPIIPGKAHELRKQLGIRNAPFDLSNAAQWGLIPAGTRTAPGEPLFPKIDLQELQREIEASHSAPEPEAPAPLEHKEPITIDDFAKVELRVVTVEKAEPHPNADKLLVLTVRMGPETRTVVSGIKAHYAPEDLVGKKLVLVTNLQPVKLRGVESQGMILAAEDAAGQLAVVTLENDMDDGSEVR